jgi:hypothetical protein
MNNDAIKSLEISNKLQEAKQERAMELTAAGKGKNGLKTLYPTYRLTPKDNTSLLLPYFILCVGCVALHFYVLEVCKSFLHSKNVSMAMIIRARCKS